ncbi:MAG: hypothetical protein Udaeo2_01340 [Candidatus Udaeobacter sp.]|nr:MAG: hypothetical protein Udaeo2_01340 [Candidatus Udaeobacter sp.]
MLGLAELALHLRCRAGPLACLHVRRFSSRESFSYQYRRSHWAGDGEYISRSIEEAQSQNAQCLIIQLNTPGGLLDSTQKIVQSFLGSPVPIVVYVAPTGATATSAGCFITIAASVAAMAPATTIGAAHPVSIGGFPSGERKRPTKR